MFCASEYPKIDTAVMDLLKKVPVPEDAVHYRLFLVHSDADTSEKTLLQLLEDLLAELTPLLAKYIWQQQPFNLSHCPEKGRSLQFCVFCSFTSETLIIIPTLS